MIRALTTRITEYDREHSIELAMDNIVIGELKIIDRAWQFVPAMTALDLQSLRVIADRLSVLNSR